MPPNHKMTRARAWQLAKRAQGLCQQCGRRPARKLTFLDGRTRISALCDRCEAKRKNAVALKFKSKSPVDSLPAKS